MGLVMQKALGRASALVVAVSILAIAYRAGTQTSPYMPVGPNSGGSSNQTPFGSMPPSSNRTAGSLDKMTLHGKPGDNGTGSTERNPVGSSPVPARTIRILSVTPTTIDKPVPSPRQPCKAGLRTDNKSGSAC